MSGVAVSSNYSRIKSIIMDLEWNNNLIKIKLHHINYFEEILYYNNKYNL